MTSKIPDPERPAVVVHVQGSPSFLLMRNAQAIQAHRRDIAAFNAKPARAVDARRERTRKAAEREAIAEKRQQMGTIGVGS